MHLKILDSNRQSLIARIHIKRDNDWKQNRLVLTSEIGESGHFSSPSHFVVVGAGVDVNMRMKGKIRTHTPLILSYTSVHT